MRRRIAFIVIVLALLLTLAITGRAGAEGEVGFNVDCTGAYGYGSVADGDFICWSVRLWDSDDGCGGNYWCDAYWYGEISGPANFDPEIEWPIAVTGGTGENDPYYWVYINGSLVQQGHFDCEPPPCGEGCTPGYWRQPQHLDDWVDYDPSDNFDTVFGTDYFNPDITLGEAVWLGGGGLKKLARHGTAALLNAASPAVDYPLTVAEVIAAVQDGEADMLADYNELGCPLD